MGRTCGSSLITSAGFVDPVSVFIDRLSGRLLNRCGQKPHRFLFFGECVSAFRRGYRCCRRIGSGLAGNSPYPAFVLRSHWPHAWVVSDQLQSHLLLLILRNVWVDRIRPTADDQSRRSRRRIGSRSSFFPTSHGLDEFCRSAERCPVTALHTPVVPIAFTLVEETMR